MATQREIDEAAKAAPEPQVIDGVWVQPADVDTVKAQKKAQEDAEKAAAESAVPTVDSKARTSANKSRSNTDTDNK